MKIHRAKLILALLALFAVCTPATRAAVQPPTPTNFFSSGTNLGEFGNGYSGYYLSYFGYYALNDSSPEYVYKFNFGFLYFFNPAKGDLSSSEAYFYDFTRGDYFYTNPSLYPYFYSFNLGSFLYYFENTNPRKFYEFKTSSFVLY